MGHRLTYRIRMRLKFNIKNIFKDHETPSATKRALETSQFINAQELDFRSVKKILLETGEGEIKLIITWSQ